MPGVAAPGAAEAANSDTADDAEEFEWPDGIPDATRAGLFGDPLVEAIDSGEVPAERLDDMVRRVLGQMDRFGRLDGSRTAAEDGASDDQAGELDSQRHRDIAADVAARGTVLLDNAGSCRWLTERTWLSPVQTSTSRNCAVAAFRNDAGPLGYTSRGIRTRAEVAVTTAFGVPQIESVSRSTSCRFR